MPDLTFKQAIIVAAVPTIIGIAATYYSQKTDSNQDIIQARMTERDLINVEGQERHKNRSDKLLSINGYMIPIAHNLAWSNYYACRIDNKKTRFDCAEEQREVKFDLTPSIVEKEVNFGS